MEYTEHFSIQKENRTIRNHAWNPPPAGILKVYIDGSFQSSEERGGWGFVIRDADGDVVGAGAGYVAHAQDALHAEAEACIKAMNYAQAWGISKIVVESDAQLLVQAINTNSHDLGPSGVLFREI